MIKHYVKLDLSKRDERKIISVSKSDQNSHKIIFTLTNGATPVTLPPDADAWVNVRGSGSPVEKAEVFPADNTIEYTPTPKAFTSSGFVVCYLQVADTVGRILYSPSFYLYVEESGKDILDVFNEAATSSNAGAQIVAILRSAIDALGTEGDNVQTHAENAEDSAQNSQKSAENASEAEQGAIEAKNEAKKITEEFQETLNTVGKSIKLEMDSKTHILRLKLLGENDRVLSEQQVDLPLESCVVGVDDFVDSAGKHWLRLTLQNGVQRNVELDAIFANMQQKLNAKQDKLPINTGGSSNRVWAATPNQYNGTTGVLIGTATFKTTPTLKETGSPVISNIGSLTPSNDYTNALLARVAELYIMEGGAYASYVKATVSGKKVNFYWTYPYYFKRIIAGSQGKDASTATASGPKVGRVTLSNYFTKWANGYINAATPYDTNASAYKTYLKAYYQYHVCGIGTEPTLTTTPKFSIFGVADNEEPLGETIVTSDTSGRILIESSDFPFHAVNNQRLDARLEEEVKKVSPLLEKEIEKVNPLLFSQVFPTSAQAVTENMSGWYRIAKTATKTGYWTNLFHILANCRRSTRVTDVILSVQRLDYSSEPTIAILSTSSKRQDAPVLTNVRIVCTRPSDPDYATECYLDVYMSESPYGEGAWEDGTAKYDFTVETLFSKADNGKWTLLEPTLVSSEIEEPWISYEKSPLTSAWSQVTAPVDDINNLARKDYVDEKTAKIGEVSAKTDGIKKLVDFIHPTMRVDLGEATYVDVNGHSINSVTSNALYYDITTDYAEGKEYGIVGDDDTTLPEDFFEDANFKIRFVPDSANAISPSTYVNGAIASITAKLNKYASSYEIKSISATRGEFQYEYWYDMDDEGNETGDVLDTFLHFSVLAEISVRLPNNEEYNQQFVLAWMWYMVGDPIGVTATIHKNEETSIFSPSTYDLRTQSIDRQLHALIEEAIAKRKAEKANTEEME